MQLTLKAIVLSLLAIIANGVSAQEDGEDSSRSVQEARVTLNGGSIYINAAGDAFQINGPDGFSVSSDQPYFDFGGDIPDGSYTFTVYMSAGNQGGIVSADENSDNGRRANAVPGQVKKLVTSGSFQIIDNTISTGE